MTYSKSIKGDLMLLLAALIWGSTFVAQSTGMQYIGPYTFNMLRSLIAIFVLLPIVLLFSKNAKEKQGQGLWQQLKPGSKTLQGGLVAGVILGIASNLQQVGISMTTAGKAAFITALYLVLVPVFDRISGGVVTKRVWICLVVAIYGFYLLSVQEDFTIALGDILVFLCSIFFALHILCIDRFLRKGADSIQMSWVQFGIAFLISGILTVLFETPNLPAIWDAKVSILYAGVLSSGGAFTLQILGQKYTKPTSATLLMSLESIFAALSGWLVLGETLTGREFSGCVLVFMAAILSQVPLTRLFKLSRNL